MQIGGPTGAFVVVVAGIVARYGIDGLFMCTGIAGVFLIFLGVTGLGSAVKYIPRPVVVGFTNGIAVVIASTQLKDFFGLRIENVPGNFLGRLEAVAQNFRTISFEETGLGVLALALILVCRTIFPQNSRLHCCAVCGHGPGLFPAPAGADDRHALWRNSFRTARVQDAALPSGPDSSADCAGDNRGHAGRD